MEQQAAEELEVHHNFETPAGDRVHGLTVSRGGLFSEGARRGRCVALLSCPWLPRPAQRLTVPLHGSMQPLVAQRGEPNAAAPAAPHAPCPGFERRVFGAARAGAPEQQVQAEAFGREHFQAGARLLGWVPG